MGTTINGHELGEVMEQLQKEFDCSELRFNDALKVPYLPYSVVKQRLDDVLGFNYSVAYDANVDELPDVGDALTPFVRIKCTITIYSDDGLVVSSRSCYGGDRIIRLSSSSGERAGYIPNYGNDLDGACSDAFKRAAKLFGVTSKLVGKGNNTGKSNTKASRSQKGAVKVLHFRSEFQPVGSTGGYSASVEDESQKPYRLVVWKNQLNIMEKQFHKSDWYKAIQFNGKCVRAIVEEKIYNGESQLVLAGFVNE